MKYQVLEAINNRLKDFSSIKSLKSLYKTESETNKGYDGRQLLEMFQNCEDEGASIVEFFFDTESKILRISNDGQKSFSLKGYDSLLYPSLSSKVSTEYIGNKGLGFRSIINWAEEIRIISNDFVLEFKESHKKTVLLEDLGFLEEDLDEIREERGYKKEVYPVPLLNCGKIFDLKEKLIYTTAIEVKYKAGFEADIIKQLKGITEETLIFLNNINIVIFSGNVFNKKIEVERNSTPDYKVIKSESKTYYLIEDDGFIDLKFTSQSDSIHPKKYSVKIAFSDNLELKGKYLYNYFQTQIPFEFPFIAHATLELDQNRNHETGAIENEFVFNKLFELHLKLIEILKNKYKKSWLPYRTVATESYDVLKKYEDLVCNKWPEIAVYPTFSDEYLTKDEAKYINNEISSFIELNNIKTDALNHIVIKCEKDLKALDYIAQEEDKKFILESVAANLGNKERAQLVKLILQEFKEIKINILIDEESKIIKSDDFAFTDKTSLNKDLIVPSYSTIRFINSELYKFLVDELNIRSLGDDVSRNLADVLSKISDIQSFEPQAVIKKIISETNRILKPKDKQTIIKEFYQVLFFNYCLRENNPKLDYPSTIPALNKNLEIVDIKSLAFSENYITGKKVIDILGKINAPENTIADLSYFGEFEDQEKFEEFLSWLGLNDCFILEIVSSGLSDNFVQSLKSHTEWKPITSYRLLNISNLTSVLQVENVNNLILWFSQDRQIFSIFNNFITQSSGEEELIYGKNKTTRGNFPNFILNQVSNLLNIKNYLLTSKRSEWFNPFIVNYDYLQEKNIELNRKEVDRILKFFGAKENFTELEISYLEQKLDELATRNNPSGAQLFYRNLVAHYKVNGKTLENPMLYARKGDDIIVDEARSIYFSDRILLPTNLTKVFPILYFPSRAGGASAIKLFGVNDLNSLHFQIENEPIIHPIQIDFENFIKEIIPFVLSFRLDKLSSQESKEDQIRRLNSLQIECCEEIECSIAGNKFAVEDMNYIISNDIYYFKIPSKIDIQSLRRDKVFADNLSDLFLKLFDINDEKRLFETIIRQSKKENEYDIENNLGFGVYEEAQILLGQISTRLSIWKAIFKLKNCTIDDELNEQNLDEYIDLIFDNLKGQERFYSANTVDELQIILKLFMALDIYLQDFNQISDIKINFNKIFNAQLKEFFSRKKKILKNSIWYNLSLKARVEQMQFLNLLKKIENFLEVEEITFDSTNPDIKDILNQRISREFTDLVPSLDFDKDIEYAKIHRKNELFFDEEELRLIKQDIQLESLKYFDNNVEFLKGEVEKVKNSTDINSVDNNTFRLNKNLDAELIEDYELEKSDIELYRKFSTTPWLASGISELSGEERKLLGNDVEDIVFDYLLKQDHIKNVDHVSKTDEGLHYDISYFCLLTNETKYVECKYYNGRSFSLSSDEKDFGYKYKSHYEIWLVDKNAKIYPIRNIDDLGDIKPKDYIINFKIKLRKGFN